MSDEKQKAAGQTAAFKKQLIIRRSAFAGMIVAAAAIGALSLVPRLPPALPVPYLDKIEHFIAYCVLCGLSLLSFRHKGKWLIVAALAVFFCSLYGGILEMLQYYTGRSRDLGDLLADIAGAVAAAALLRLFNR